MCGIIYYKITPQLCRDILKNTLKLRLANEVTYGGNVRIWICIYQHQQWQVESSHPVLVRIAPH